MFYYKNSIFYSENKQNACIIYIYMYMHEFRERRTETKRINNKEMDPHAKAKSGGLGGTSTSSSYLT